MNHNFATFDTLLIIELIIIHESAIRIRKDEATLVFFEVNPCEVSNQTKLWDFIVSPNHHQLKLPSVFPLILMQIAWTSPVSGFTAVREETT